MWQQKSGCKSKDDGGARCGSKRGCKSKDDGGARCGSKRVAVRARMMVVPDVAAKEWL